jgi:uncharacterized integral membrane protein (TIGR00698 family)
MTPAEAAAALPASDSRAGRCCLLSVLRHNWPGLVVLVLGVAASYAVNRAVPSVSALTVAVFLGALTRNSGMLRPGALRGMAPVTKKLLRAGIVLLGLQLAFAQILVLDAAVLLVIVLTVTVTFAGTIALGRWMGVRPGTVLLIATGFSICGASAAAAMAAASDSDEEDLAAAIALVTIFGTLAIFGLPLLRHAASLPPTSYGVWAGSSVHEVAQVVAAAAAAGPAALAVATLVKLTRVVLLAPLIAGYSLLRRRKHRFEPNGKRPPLVPLFVLGFLAMGGLRSTGVLPATLLADAKTLTTLMLAGALFGLGTSVHLPALVRTGTRPMILGAASTALAAVTSLATIVLLV